MTYSGGIEIESHMIRVSCSCLLCTCTEGAHAQKDATAEHAPECATGCSELAYPSSRAVRGSSRSSSSTGSVHGPHYIHPSLYLSQRHTSSAESSLASRVPQVARACCASELARGGVRLARVGSTTLPPAHARQQPAGVGGDERLSLPTTSGSTGC